MLGRFLEEIASRIQRLLKCLKTGDLDRRTMQLLQALQIVNGGNDVVKDMYLTNTGKSLRECSPAGVLRGAGRGLNAYHR